MASSLLGLAPGGGYLAIRITTDAGGLLHHLFTITPLTRSPLPMGEGRRGEGWLFVSVALIRQVSSSRRVPRPGCYPTPCSMECGLSSIPTTQDRDRPTDLRQLHHTRMTDWSQLEIRKMQSGSDTCTHRRRGVDNPTCELTVLKRDKILENSKKDIRIEEKYNIINTESS